MRWKTMLMILALAVTGCASTEKHGAKQVARKPGEEVQVEELEVGAGPKPKPGQIVTVHYEGRLKKTGAVFDNSRNRNKPLSFVLGKGHVIQGWEDAVPEMQVGGKYRVIVPPGLAYGNTPHDNIPPNSTLVFDIELIGVRDGELAEQKKGGRGGRGGGGFGRGGRHGGMGGMGTGF
jgi:FKBP-type peptidyl-prolyl cis-trans isomerase FkpA